MRLTEHARRRAKTMRVTDAEIDAVFAAEDRIDYPSNQEDDCRVAISGRLAIPYNPTEGVIITILWRGMDDRFPGESVRLGQG